MDSILRRNFVSLLTLKHRLTQKLEQLAMSCTDLVVIRRIAKSVHAVRHVMPLATGRARPLTMLGRATKVRLVVRNQIVSICNAREDQAELTDEGRS